MKTLKNKYNKNSVKKNIGSEMTHITLAWISCTNIGILL